MLCEPDEQTFQKIILAKPGRTRIEPPARRFISTVNFERATQETTACSSLQPTENCDDWHEDHTSLKITTLLSMLIKNQINWRLTIIIFHALFSLLPGIMHSLIISFLEAELATSAAADNVGI